MDREPVSKKVRFDVFKRDLFACQYCGQTPPAVVLEVDHVVPVAGGGLSDIDNLLTACFDCNRGKGAASLSVTPETLEQKRVLIEERRAQLLAYEELLHADREDAEARVDRVQAVFQESFPELEFSLSFRRSVRTFLRHLPVGVIEDAMDIACGRVRNANSVQKYFCGVCWKRIREAQSGGAPQ